MIKMAQNLRLSYVLTRHYLENIPKTTIFSGSSGTVCSTPGASFISARKYCSSRDKEKTDKRPKKRPVPPGGSYMSGTYRYKYERVEPFPLDRVDEILHDLHEKDLIDSEEFLTSQMPSPFQQEERKCLLCEQKIDLDYKNIRLLNQFVSQQTGIIFRREHTDLCIPMYKRVKELINRARAFGLMPHLHGVPEFEYDEKVNINIQRKKAKDKKKQSMIQ